MSKFILNCDTGIDDALAIAYAATVTTKDLLGVTVSYGMAPADYSFRNTKKILALLGKSDIPVYRGSETPLTRKRVYSGNFHGHDGIGNLLGKPSTEENALIPTKTASEFIYEQVMLYPGEVTLVTTGPLTNLAELLATYPDITDKFSKVVVMGGALTSEGNVGKFAEANVFIDPEAANQVMTSGLNVTIVPLDVTRRTLLTRKNVKEWEEIGSEASLFFAKFVTFYLDAYAKYHPYLAGCALHDPLAVAVAIDPTLVLEELAFNLKVDLSEEALGRLVEDNDKIELEPMANVVLRVDVKKFQETFYGSILQKG